MSNQTGNKIIVSLDGLNCDVRKVYRNNPDLFENIMFGYIDGLANELGLSGDSKRIQINECLTYLSQRMQDLYPTIEHLEFEAYLIGRGYDYSDIDYIFDTQNEDRRGVYDEVCSHDPKAGELLGILWNDMFEAEESELGFTSQFE